ncbi:aspartic-type endopeptidase, partial [Aphelenchoides avenae]
VKDCGSKPATGQSTGYLVMDNIVIGSSNAAVSFFLMNHSQHLNPQWGSDGWFGMAIDPFNCRYDERNCTVLGFLKAFSQPVVAVYLKGNRANYFSSGIISFGSTSLSQCRWSAWTWLPKGEPRFPGWNVMLKSFSLPSYNSGALNQPAALMTNAAYIWAPPANFKKIISALDAEYSFADDEYVVKCADVANNQGAMTFTFDGYNQVATPYRALPRDPKTCVVLVRDSSEFFPAGLNVWVLGNSFMLDACHAFDYKNQLIGFAQAS